MSDSRVQLLPSVTGSDLETVQYAPANKPAAGFAAPASRLLPIGTALGHYVVKSYIGGGGMGQVYLATDAALDRDVAIKVLTQQRAGDQSTVARFMNEARSAARLNHEHIAQIYFAGTESGIPFIAFEYVEGMNVRTMIEENNVFPLPQALNYLIQIANALAHAATHNVVHRDVKPSNILITREGRAKLIDMGLARLLDPSEAKNDLTASGVTLGTFDYISPEQARDPRNADIRSDIYSLGCTFFFMLAGRPPFPEGTVLQKLLQHQGDAPPDIRSFQPSIPAEIAFIIQKMMAKDPKQRFQTPTTLIEALTQAALNLGMRPSGQGNLIWTPGETARRSVFQKHVPWAVAVMLLLVGVAVQSLLSERYEPLPIPEIGVSVPVVTESVPILQNEPVISAGRYFDAAFVTPPPNVLTQSTGQLTVRITGGSLQPRLATAAGLHEPVSGQFTAKFPAVKPSGPNAASIQTTGAVRCVDPAASSPGTYSTLASALADAEEDTVIELKWNNVLRITEPIQINNQRIRLTAADGYHPILLFEPTTGLQSIRSFFTVFSSHVSFHHIGIVIQLNPNVLSPHWSLFEVSGKTNLAFEQCCLTVQNRTIFDNAPYHDDVVFFRNSVPLDNLTEPGRKESFAEPLTIDIRSSLLRGEAAAVQNNVPQDIVVKCSNSLFTLARPFIQMDDVRPSPQPLSVQIQWDRIAYFGRQSVISLSSGTAASTVTPGEAANVNFQANQSVCVSNNFPFALLTGFSSRESVLSHFHWTGNSNYFQRVLGLRLSAGTFASTLGTETEGEISLSEWVQSGNNKEPTQIDVLMIHELSKPVSQYLPQDLRSAFGSASNVPLPNFDWFPKQWEE